MEADREKRGGQIRLHVSRAGPAPESEFRSYCIMEARRAMAGLGSASSIQ